MKLLLSFLVPWSVDVEKCKVLLLRMKPDFLSGSLQDLLSAPVFERAHFSDLMAPCPFSKLGVLHALSTQRLGVLSSSIVQILVLKYFSHFLLTFSQALFLAILLFVHCTSWTDFKIFIFFPVSLYFDSMFGTISSPSFFNTTVGFFPLFCSFFIPKSYMLLSEWSFLYLPFN